MLTTKWVYIVDSMYTYYTACTENHDDVYKIKHKFKNKECIAVTVSVKKNDAQSH